MPSVGLKGTSHSLPHSEQVALCISLGPSKSLRGPEPKLFLGPSLEFLSPKPLFPNCPIIFLLLYTNGIERSLPSYRYSGIVYLLVLYKSSQKYGDIFTYLKYLAIPSKSPKPLYCCIRQSYLNGFYLNRD